MRMLWTLHPRRLTVVVGLVVVFAASSAVVWAGSHHGGSHFPQLTGARSPSGTKKRSVGRTTEAPPRRPAPTSLRKVPQTSLQRRIDSQLAEAETSAAIAAAQRTSVPTPAVSSAYPSISRADRGDPGAYATAFTTELLDIDFAMQSRDSLLEWAEHEEAPNSLPGVPTSVAGKALVLSLADPNLPGGSPSPVPSAAQWVADTQTGLSQSVADVQAEVDPDWTEIISQGWQPRDPLMTIEVVTGTMTVASNGVSAPPESFSLTLTLGSAAHAGAGYGAVAVADWTLD